MSTLRFNRLSEVAQSDTNVSVASVGPWTSVLAPFILTVLLKLMA